MATAREMADEIRTLRASGLSDVRIGKLLKLSPRSLRRAAGPRTAPPPAKVKEIRPGVPTTAALRDHADTAPRPLPSKAPQAKQLRRSDGTFGGKDERGSILSEIRPGGTTREGQVVYRLPDSGGETIASDPRGIAVHVTSAVEMDLGEPLEAWQRLRDARRIEIRETEDGDTQAYDATPRCHQCGRTFIFPDTLDLHVRRLHQDRLVAS